VSGAESLRARWGAHVPGLLGARRSYAVLCPLAEGPGGLELLFEVRAAALHRQPGEVCFPGGAAEDGETPLRCALRETREELAIAPEHIAVLGLGDFICNQAGFVLQPVIGLVSPEGLEEMRPSPAEVAETFRVPLAFFRRTAPKVYTYPLEPRIPDDFPYETVGIDRDYTWARGQVTVPVWVWQGHAIWGMTARLAQMLARDEA
jgi:coenzyme A diphosphatase NUDT7